MYAIIEDGGMQYKVAEGDTVCVGLRDAQPGEAIEFASVLLLSDENGATVGQPTVDGARVIGEVAGEEKGKKIRVQRFRRRQGMHRRRVGHRQRYTSVRIRQILMPGQAAEPVEAAAEGEGEADGS